MCRSMNKGRKTVPFGVCDVSVVLTGELRLSLLLLHACGGKVSVLGNNYLVMSGLWGVVIMDTARHLRGGRGGVVFLENGRHIEETA